MTVWAILRKYDRSNPPRSNNYNRRSASPCLDQNPFAGFSSASLE